MRKAISIILVLCMLLFPILSAQADPGRADLQRRIVFVEDENEWEFYVLTDEGTVFANDTGYKLHPEIKDWKNLIAFRAETDIAVGLTKDGFVLVSVSDPELAYIIDQVRQWHDIEQIAVSYQCVYGLTAGNQIQYAGHLFSDQKASLETSDSWGHIKYITANYFHLFAITDNNHVFSTMKEDFSALDHVTEIVSDGLDTFFLKDDGTYVMYTEWEEGIGTFHIPDEKDILQMTFLHNSYTAKLTTDHEVIYPSVIYPVYIPLKSFTDPSVVAISGYAWVDNEGVIHMDQGFFGLENVELPRLTKSMPSVENTLGQAE